MNKLASIELLRFIAANLIILFHYVGFRQGFIGVDIFFIISGFVITYATESNSKNFFIRRLIRIIPLYWSLTILFVLVLIFLPKLFNQSYFNIIFLIKSLLFIPFENNNIGPGLGHSPYIFLGWTLNYEIFFYLLFQISILINAKYRAIICIIFICLFQIFLFNNSSNNFAIKTFSHPVIYEFCLGMYLYYLYVFVYYRKIDNILIIITSLFIFIIFYNYYFYDVMKLLLPFLIVVTFLGLNYFLHKFKFLNILGNITYPIYLIHVYINTALVKAGFVNAFFNITFAYSFTIILSLISYYFFEKKIINFLNSKLKKFEIKFY